MNHRAVSSFLISGLLITAVSSWAPAASFAKGETLTSEAQLPRFWVDTSQLSVKGRTLVVHAAGDFQEALDTAKPGDEIVLEAGATFRGPFRLPAKQGDDWIIVRTSSENLPPPGSRVGPAHARLMPKLTASAGSVVATEPGAHHYRFVGIEILAERGTYLLSLVTLGSGRESHPERLAHHITVDRCFLHGDSLKGARRGVTLNGSSLAVIDSYLSDFKEVGADSQAILGWNGPGPFKIVNNYLEGAGENLMFGGGADPAVQDLVPSDIEIRFNHFSKPLVWKVNDPAYDGIPWTVKNLFELKNARRVLVEGNLFERNWPHAQNGFAILFTVRNQNGAAPWCVVEDVTFMNNLVRHVAAGINILGRDDLHPSRQTARIVIRNNLFQDMGGIQWGGNGTLFQLLNGTAQVSIDHNTASHTGNIITADGAPHQVFAFTNNVTLHNAYGIIGTGSGVGLPTLDRYFPNAVVEGNVIGGGSPQQYPPGNAFPTAQEAERLLDGARARSQRSGLDRRTGSASAQRPPGVDWDSLCAVLQHHPPVQLPCGTGPVGAPGR